MENEVKKLLDVKIIVPLRYFDWIENLVPMRKKNGEIKLCVDFRNLNRCSQKDNYPLPKMEHILQRVVRSSRLSMIDGFSRYNKVVFHPDDMEKTSFTTPWGTFMYSRMPFGLMNVRKTGPRSNKIKQMQKQNTEDTQYKRDTDLRGSPSVGYVHQRNCQVLPLLLSSK
jgi:hypothetical protein